MSDSIARVSRAFDLIPYILRNPGISFQELEEKFAIDTKELLLELNLIFCCGLPGYTPLELIDISFDDGYVTVTNPQVLTSPRKLTKNELMTISLGLNLLRNSLTEDLKLSCDALINRVSSLLGDQNSLISIPEEDDATLSAISKAVLGGNKLTFEYASANSDSLTQRDIKPIEMRSNGKHRYLIGFEIESKIEKTFRVDRIRNLIIGDVFQKVVKEKTLKVNSKCRLFISNKALNFIDENKIFITKIKDVANGKEIDLQGISRNWVISEIFAFGGELSVLEPQDLKIEVASRAKSRLDEDF